ncbi:hypothetical protein [Shinella sp.]|uniref:hypothetical protein n=1 Tax=Shinella sp. TaxID=1870904 RepID=UPI003F718E90
MIRSILPIVALAALIPISHAAQQRIPPVSDRAVSGRLPDQVAVTKRPRAPMARQPGLTIQSVDGHQDKLLLRPTSRHMLRGRGLDKVREIQLSSRGTRSMVRILSRSDTQLQFEMRTAPLGRGFPAWDELKNPFELTLRAEYKDPNGLIRAATAIFPESRYMVPLTKWRPSSMPCDPLPCKRTP